jgi:hypothetical protein
MAEYEGLASWHYAAGRPVAPRMVLTARDGGAVVGVLVVTRPVLNGAWRAAAWPRWSGELATLSPRGRAVALNAGLSTIARVIVDPRVRGAGVGTGLVRAYLAEPLTGRVECLSRLAAHQPMLARAGMREVAAARDAGREALRAVLGRAGVAVWMLADGAVRRAVAKEAGVMAAWRRWAMRSCATRRACDGTAAELVEGTWGRVAGKPVVMVWGGSDE